MRRTFSVLALLILTACANSDVWRLGKFLYATAAGSSVRKVPRERAAAIPYATMGMELGSNPEALLVLGTASPEKLEWFAGEQVFIETRRGRVTRTAGLPYDLGGLKPVSAAESGSQDLRFAVDFPDLGIFGAAVECSRRTLGDDSVEILGASIPTRHVVEHCAVRAMRWTFDNDFWEDRETGYVWRSRQRIHPQSPPLTLEVLRPETPAAG